jgi:transcriptional regulator with XRE-family HTH domain
MLMDFIVVGEFFRVKREAAGFSQRYLSEKLGYSSPQMISNWERGLCAPPIDAIVQMVALFKLSKGAVIDLLLSENRRYLERQLSVRSSKKK